MGLGKKAIERVKHAAYVASYGFGTASTTRLHVWLKSFRLLTQAQGLKTL